MPVNLSYIIPARIITTDVERAVRAELERKLTVLSLNSGIVTSEDALVIRDAVPNTDFGLTSNWWLSAAMVANTEMTLLTVALNNKRHVGFYGVWVEGANPAVSMLYFRIGATGSTTFALFNLEELYAEEIAIGYFPEPVIYVPNETLFIRALPRIAAAGGERIGLKCLIAEPKGEQISGARVFAV